MIKKSKFHLSIAERQLCEFQEDIQLSVSNSLLFSSLVMKYHWLAQCFGESFIACPQYRSHYMSKTEDLLPYGKTKACSHISVNLGIGQDDKLAIYKENFEKAYIDSTVQFYMSKASEFLAQNGVREYMVYAQTKLTEEEDRAKRYLETSQGCDSVTKVGFDCIYYAYSCH